MTRLNTRLSYLSRCPTVIFAFATDLICRRNGILTQRFLFFFYLFRPKFEQRAYFDFEKLTFTLAPRTRPSADTVVPKKKSPPLRDRPVSTRYRAAIERPGGVLWIILTLKSAEFPVCYFYFHYVI